MTNEWQEFLDYTEKPFYASSSKSDLSYLGRFTFNTLKDFEGMGHILTILARGYLFHEKDGELTSEDPYGRIDHAREALCAWCSVPGKDDAVNFGRLSGQFPELVSTKGEGWLYRHVKGIIRYAKKNPQIISVAAAKSIAQLSKGFTAEWRKKLRQMQVPIFALNTKAAWPLLFDSVIAEALDTGPLRKKAAALPPELEEKLRQTDLNGVPYEVVYEVLNYCVANKGEGEEYLVLPVANFDCFFGNTSFSRKWKSKLPTELITTEYSGGVCRAKVAEKSHQYGSRRFDPLLQKASVDNLYPNSRRRNRSSAEAGCQKQRYWGRLPNASTMFRSLLFQSAKQSFFGNDFDGDPIGTHF